MKFSVIAALFLASFSAHADNGPDYSNVLGAVTADFNGDGGFDRAVLVNNPDNGGDLYIYLSKFDQPSGQFPMELTLVAKDAAYNGNMWGQQPSLMLKDNGAIVIHSENIGVSRDRWSQDLTVAYRNNEFVVAGVTYNYYDTLDPNHNGNCDLNYLTGAAKRNGKAVKFEKQHHLIVDWHEASLPAICDF